MKTTLFLTRHGETEWNVEGKLQGHKDSPLTLLGRQQARWLGKSMHNIQLDAIYCSSSQRACHTAKIIRGTRELAISACDSLKEINMGTWEGRNRVELESTCPKEHSIFWSTPHLYKPHNDGETFVQLRERIIPAIKEIIAQHKGGHILIVSHAIALKVIMTHFRGDSLEHIWTPPIIQPASLSKVSVNDAESIIEQYGDVSHYQTVRTKLEGRRVDQ